MEKVDEGQAVCLEGSHRWEEISLSPQSRQEMVAPWAGVVVMGVGRRGWIPQRFRMQQSGLGDGLAVEDGGDRGVKGDPPTGF